MSDEPKPRRRWGRWLVGMAVIVVMVAVMAYAVNDQSLRGGVAGAVKELDRTDPGWRLADLLAARPEVSDEDNSVPRIRAVVRSLPPRWPDEKEARKLEGRPPNVLLDAGQRAALDGLLMGTPRERARDLVRFPRGRFELAAAGPSLWHFASDFENLRAIVPLLDLDSRALALDGRPDDALAAARAMFAVAGSLAEDPTNEGEWLRMWMRERAFVAVERALALGEPSDAALAAVGGDTGPFMQTLSLRTSRAMLHETFTAIGRGDLDARELARAFAMRTPDVFEHGGALLRREMVRREHLTLLRLMTRMVEASRLPPPKQFAEDAAIEAEFAKATGTFTKLVAGLMMGGNAQGRRAAASGAAIRALVAVERYRLKHKKWPARLDDVVPDFLDRVPVDPIDEAPLRYKRTADGVVLYSIGNDRKDDGGDVGEGKPDVGFRLWDVGKRRSGP